LDGAPDVKTDDPQKLSSIGLRRALTYLKTLHKGH
jgi:hypothetical protein